MAAQSTKSAPPLKVLIVHASDAVRERCADVLQSGPWPVRIERVDLMVTARERLATETWDCAIIGRQLEDGSGLSVLREIADLNDDVPAVVIISDGPTEDSAPVALRAGAQDYVIRERIGSDLLRAVRHGMERKHLQDRLRRANRRLASLSERDALTGLLNRRGLETRLRVETRRADAAGTPLSALVVDLDHFKKVNDRYGHVGGDRMLSEVAQQLMDCSRITDHVARVGGDEFILLLTDASLLEARNLGERLRMHLHGAAVTLDGDDVRVTASMAAIRVPTSAGSVKELLELGRYALSQSKRGGRDRVSVGGGSATRNKSRGRRPRRITLMHEQIQRAALRTTGVPIRDLRSGERHGVEVHMRASGSAEVSTDAIFATALNEGRLPELDLSYLHQRLRKVDELSDTVRLHVSLFPETLLSESFEEALTAVAAVADRRKIAIGMSVNLLPPEPQRLLAPVKALRRVGAALELLDVGGGGGTLDALLHLKPEIVRIGGDMIAGGHSDPTRRKACERLVRLLHALGCGVIADGVDQDLDLPWLLRAGINAGLGRAVPMPVKGDEDRGQRRDDDRETREPLTGSDIRIS